MSALDAFSLTLTDGLRAVGPLRTRSFLILHADNKVGEGGWGRKRKLESLEQVLHEPG